MTLTLLLTSLACNAATSLIEPNTSPSPSTSTQAMQQAACPALLDAILQAATASADIHAPEQESLLVTYAVNGNDLEDPQFEAVPSQLQDEQADLGAQQTVWNYFTTIIPEKNRPYLTEFSILTDGQGNLLAAVAQSQRDPTHWRLEVDIADTHEYANLTFTLIHEYGHLLTLNAEQIYPSPALFAEPNNSEIRAQEAAACPNFYAREGCSGKNSYINQFYQRFWIDKYAEWNQVAAIQDDYLYYVRLNEFYEKYQDQFVTSYAATNPGEDIAESWTYFVLAPQPQGSTIAEQKVLFFYEFPELVEVRQEIQTNLCSAYPN